MRFKARIIELRHTTTQDGPFPSQQTSYVGMVAHHIEEGDLEALKFTDVVEVEIHPAGGDRPAKAVNYVVTDYHSGDHRPYQGSLHDAEHDAAQGIDSVIADLLDAAGAVDGDEVEIVVRKTGRRPFGDRRMVLVAANTYKREPAHCPCCDADSDPGPDCVCSEGCPNS